MFGLIFAALLASRQLDDPSASRTPPPSRTPSITGNKKNVDFSAQQQAILYTTGALAAFVIISGAIITCVCRRKRMLPGAKRIEDQVAEDLARPEADALRETNL